jgi:hypothetical protein
MTPTLIGRWQTRLLLLGTLGVVITIPFSLVVASALPFHVLAAVAIFGVVFWDPIYNYLQTWSWDHDWPALFQLIAGIWEGLFVYLVFTWLLPLLGIAGLASLTPNLFVIHYGLVWLAVFTASQTLMRVLFPRWRFRGGQWL